MKSLRRRCSRLRPLGLGFAVLTLFAPWAAAEEPAADFLSALRKKGYYDVAIDYLDHLKTSPVAPQKVRETIGYERGVTLVDGAKHQRDFALREKQLDEAQAALEEFVAQQPNHDKTFSASSQLGNVVVERARLKLDRVKRPAEPNKEKLRSEAKELYAKGYATFNTLGDGLKTKLEAIPKILDPKKDAARIEQREQMRADYLQAQLLAAAVLEESADTMDKSAKEYKETLEKAAKEYGVIYEKYRTRVAGLYARMYQGRSFQKLGNFKDALSYYEELLAQPDEPKEFHDLKTMVLLLAIDCWMSESQKKYAEIVNRGNQWIDKAYPSEMRSDEFMGLRLAVAQASKAYSDQLKKEKPKDPQINALLTDARKLAQFVAKTQNEHQKSAQKFLSDLGVAGAGPEAGALPKTFKEAQQAGKDALDAYQVHKLSLEALPSQIAGEKDAAVKKELETKLAEAQEGLKTSLGDAMRFFKLALKLTDKETTPDDLNVIRYYLCFLSFTAGDYFDAAAIGTFVAARYPESGGARQCARIAMASYQRMFADAKNAAKQPIEALLGELDEDKDGKLSAEEVKAGKPAQQAMLAGADVDNSGKIDNNELLRVFTRFEADHIIEAATYITTKWPDQPEAQEALGTLIAFMISENQLEKAQAYLDKIPEDAAPRGTAELKMGQALWASYLRGMAAIREQENAATATGTPLDAAATAQIATRKQELSAVKNRAEKTLADGVARMEKGGKIDVVFTAAILSLSQIYVDTEQAQKAVGLLEKEAIGPLSLVRSQNEMAQRQGYAEDVLKTALRAYISALSAASAKDADELVKKAEGIMNELKETVGSTEEGAKKLVSIYFTLAKDIEQQMELASPDAKKNLSKGFETFLNQVGAGAKELNILYWVASTFYSMGESYGTQKDGTPTPEAKKYYGQAAKTFQDILDRAGKKQLEVEPQLLNQITLSLAKTKREMADYEGSITIFKQVLTAKSSLLSVQMEAAKTYELWAERSGESKYYLNALGGSMETKGKKSTIWGWIEMAKITSNRPEFRDAFYESRYHVSLARYKYGLAQKDTAKRNENLEKAESSLSQTYQLFPALDGDPAENKKSFRETYDGLAKAIQKSLKKKTEGLAAYDKLIPKTGTGAETKSGTGVNAKGGATAKPGTTAKPTTPTATGAGGATTKPGTSTKTGAKTPPAKPTTPPATKTSLTPSK